MPVIPSTGRFIYIHFSISFLTDKMALMLNSIQTIPSILFHRLSNTDNVSCVFFLQCKYTKNILKKQIFEHIYAIIFS